MDGTEAKLEAAVITLEDGDLFSRESGVDEEEVAPPSDAAIGDYLSNRRAIWVLDGRELRWKRSSRWFVDSCGCLVVQCFVWAFVVVLDSKPVERILLPT